MNHVGFMISPELMVVQDEVQGFGSESIVVEGEAMHPRWCMVLTPMGDQL
jgi:hypothetical protein